ncbi:hypothetical protein CBM2585_A140050 [Cupriavidus taiwanensis]|nr:hypothetical protein CBM2585_A140050 [Cupriavidus taiwanensis]
MARTPRFRVGAPAGLRRHVFSMSA